MPTNTSATFSTRKCVKCGHELAGRMVRCIYCGEAAGPHEQHPRRPCPRCCENMEVTVSRWVSIDRCGKCQGEFYGADEIDRSLMLDDRGHKWLAENMVPRETDSATGQSLACPACTTPMRTFLVPASFELKIDICTVCKGTWLDAGEGVKLKRAVAEGELPVVAPDLGMGAVGFNPRRGLGPSTGSYAGDLVADVAVDAVLNGLTRFF